ncbi:hypothetical protein, partial [Thiolapillus sp.]|uniref:hypothetical protein n=1 Tax=Thiolapillus sp. TaxID=2017437 RepID=UPI003AF47B46
LRFCYRGWFQSIDICQVSIDHSFSFLDYPPSSAARQPNLVASNPADIGKPGFLNDANQG